MQEDVGEVTRRFLTAETGASTLEEKKRLIRALLKASQEFPNYFVDNPQTSSDACKRDIFILATKINYFESFVSPTCIDRLKRDLNDRRSRLATLDASHKETLQFKR